MVGGPPECGAQIRQLEGEPGVGFALARTVPERHDVRLPRGEVTRMRVADRIGLPENHELFLGELTNGFQQREASPRGRSVGDR